MTFGPEGKSSFGALKLTLQHEGPRGLFRGFGTTLMRDVSAAGVASYSETTLLLTQLLPDSLHRTAISYV